ncbi:hypothetical protein [Pseudomonas antarctica]|uniref:hypothetical protein n=1 Tax=Pseudomonas antarctica TaxID=219572 RepID=UPI00387AE1BA
MTGVEQLHIAQNRNVFVCGGSNGIGPAVVKTFVAKGYHTSTCARNKAINNSEASPSFAGSAGGNCFGTWRGQQFKSIPLHRTAMAWYAAQ